MPTQKNLTTNSYWVNNWKGLKIPVPENLKSYSRFRLNKIFQTYLPHGKLKILEVGCCPGTWLHYFNKFFGYLVSGVEYTKNGYDYTNVNLRALNLTADIRNEDILKTTFKKESFDLVFSHGIIEHFKDPTEMINAHLNLLKKGGYLIIGVPNVGSKFYGPIQRFLSKDIYNSHVVVTREWLNKKLNRTDLKKVYCDYSGVFNLFLLNLTNQNKILKLIQEVLGMLFNKILHILKINKESAFFSPYVYYIGVKKK